jgi:hypothetical protein
LNHIGRVRTVLVHHQSNGRCAVITEIIARTMPNTLQRVVFSPPLIPDPEAQTHITNVILPILDSIVMPLGVPTKTIELSGVNIGAAAIAEVGVEINGFSADLPIFLALLSCSLQMEISDEFVATGHLASIDGDVAMVSGVAAKVRAAVAHEGIRCFIYPSADQSVELMTPFESESIKKAIYEAKSQITVHEVRNVFEFLRTVLDENSIALASVISGFVDAKPSKFDCSAPIETAIQFLSDDNIGRFWRAVESAALNMDVARLQNLLSAWMRHHSNGNIYPRRTGSHLRQILSSLAPHVRRKLYTKTIIDPAICLELGKVAAPEDLPDLNALFDVAIGGLRDSRLHETIDTSPFAAGPQDYHSLLQYLLRELDECIMSERIVIPLGTARAKFTLQSVVTDSFDELKDTISTYYLFLARHHFAIVDNPPPEQSGPDALALLERAFDKYGGLSGARAEARDGIKGGLRFILDRMTDQLIAEQKEKYVRMILRENLDPLNWDLKVAVTKELLKQLGFAATEAAGAQPAERYAANCETLVRTFASSQEQLKSLLRTM